MDHITVLKNCSIATFQLLARLVIDLPKETVTAKLSGAFSKDLVYIQQKTPGGASLVINVRAFPYHIEEQVYHT